MVLFKPTDDLLAVFALVGLATFTRAPGDADPPRVGREQVCQSGELTPVVGGKRILDQPRPLIHCALRIIAEVRVLSLRP